MSQEDLGRVLARVREWEPFDGGALLDDVAAALDEVMPAESYVDELAERLHGHLDQLVTIAVAAEAEHRDPEAARLIDYARVLRSQDVPGCHRRAVGHLRRIGWIANELLERLVATRCLSEAP
ncbi:DUF6415 family natural product biosynthesis protein [Streptomyces sp. NPDC003697]